MCRWPHSCRGWLEPEVVDLWPLATPWLCQQTEHLTVSGGQGHSLWILSGEAPPPAASPTLCLQVSPISCWPSPSPLYFLSQICFSNILTPAIHY